jgi:hypothetical protein
MARIARMTDEHGSSKQCYWIVVQNGIIQHVEYVPIGGQEPNYDATLAALKELST